MHSAAEGMILMSCLIIFSPAFGDVLLMTADPDKGFYQAEPSLTGYSNVTFTATSIPLSGNPFAMAFDYRSGFLYWTDRDAETVSRAKLDGSEYSVLISQDTVRTRGIAIDTVNDRVLWCDVGKNQIEFVNFDGTNRGVLIDSDIVHPKDVVVSKKNGFVIWCNSDLEKIERSNINGTGRIVIVASDVGYFRSLVLDYIEERVYWSSKGTNRIESVYLNGSDRRVHVTGVVGESTFNPYVIALRGVENDLYFTDSLHEMLYWLDKTDDVTVAKKVVSSPTQLPNAPKWLLFIQDPIITTESVTTGPSTTANSPSRPAMNSKLFAAPGAPNTNACMRGHVIDTARATTRTQCAMTCSLNSDCLSFNFDHGSDLCELNDRRQEQVSLSVFDVPDSSCRYFELKK